MIEVILVNGHKFNSKRWKMSFHGIELTKLSMHRFMDEGGALSLENDNEVCCLAFDQIAAITAEKEK